MTARARSPFLRDLKRTGLVAGAVGLATTVATTALTGIDKQRGVDRALARRHPGPYSDEERRAAVEAYIDSITTPAAAFDVPFAPDCVRHENGLKTGFGGTQLRWDLHLHLQYSTIKNITNLRLTVDPDGHEGYVHAEFDIVTVLGVRAHVSEEFLVPASDGLIHEIDADITLG